MHTDHTTKEEGVITMTVTNGLFILGKLISGNKLQLPRIFSIIKDGREMMLSPLPGTPLFITIGVNTLHYPIPLDAENKNLLALYDKVTHPQPQPSSNIVMPFPGRGGTSNLN
jgi:hypothetical protein